MFAWIKIFNDGTKEIGTDEAIENKENIALVKFLSKELKINRGFSRQGIEHPLPRLPQLINFFLRLLLTMKSTLCTLQSLSYRIGASWLQFKPVSLLV
jgi:hypothetical protein